jgi:hypothetical protein
MPAEVVNQRAPRVLNKHKDRIPVGAVYIGRGSIWGNPYSTKPSRYSVIIVATVEEAIELYANTWLPELLATTDANLEDLRGRDLVCYCAPEPCHGDVLLEAANGD